MARGGLQSLLTFLTLILPNRFCFCGNGESEEASSPQLGEEENIDYFLEVFWSFICLASIEDFIFSPFPPFSHQEKLYDILLCMFEKLSVCSLLCHPLPCVPINMAEVWLPSRKLTEDVMSICYDSMKDSSSHVRVRNTERVGQWRWRRMDSREKMKLKWEQAVGWEGLEKLIACQFNAFKEPIIYMYTMAKWIWILK